MTLADGSVIDQELEKIIEVARQSTSAATLPGTTDAKSADRLSADALFAAASFGIEMGSKSRVELMNDLGSPLRIPSGGFRMGQSRLIEGSSTAGTEDIRLLGLLQELVRRGGSRAASANLLLVEHLVCRTFPDEQLSPFLVMMTAYREWGPSVTDRSSEPLNTYDKGGLDYLAANKSRLGLPKSITDLWGGGGSFENDESTGKRKSIVHPAEIPRMHQLLAYGAQMRLSFSRFLEWLHDTHPTFIPGGGRLSTSARRAWQSYAFLAPGGAPHVCGTAPHHGQKFGVRSAAQYLYCVGETRKESSSLNDILTETLLHHTYFVVSAKMRTVESLFFEHLLDRAGYPEALP